MNRGQIKVKNIFWAPLTMQYLMYFVIWCPFDFSEKTLFEQYCISTGVLKFCEFKF